MDARAAAIQSEPLAPGSGGPAQDGAVGREALVWVLGALSQVFRIPFDEQLVSSQLTPPCDIDTIVRIADSLGLRAAWKKLPAARLSKLAAPFIVLLRPQRGEPGLATSGREPPGIARQRFALVVRQEAGRVPSSNKVRRATPLCPGANSKRATPGKCCKRHSRTSHLSIPMRKAPPRRASVSAGSSPNCSSIRKSSAMCSSPRPRFNSWRWPRRCLPRPSSTKSSFTTPSIP